MAAASPTARALAECRKRGWMAHVVEKYNSFTRRKSDLFGFIDIVALDGQQGVLGLQVTSSDHIAGRVDKIRGECAEAFAAWVAAGNRVAVWGWAKRGAAGRRKVWRLREVEVTT